MKYIKKPIPIEISEPWWEDGDHPNVRKALEIYPETNPNTECPKCKRPYYEHGQIETLEGWHIVCPGDRIVTGVQGEQYPIKPDIFEQTYEKVDNNRPQIVCLCGSSRFVAEMAVLSWNFEKEGWIALGLHLLPVGYKDEIKDHLAEAEGVAEQMDELHRRKIDLADMVFVVNKGGYIGKSTANEIEYAKRHNKIIKYME